MLEEISRREQVDNDLLRRYRDNHDLLAREELAERCLPLVKSLARKYHGRGEDMEDLVQAGTVGLVKAIDRYDPSGGHRFVSYAVPNITGEIRRHFRDHTWAVHVPRSLQELDLKIQVTRREMSAASGREPSEQDLATELDVPLGEVREARAAGRSYRALSTDAPAGEARELADTHGAIDPGYDRIDAAATLEDAMTVLDDRERRVIDMRFGDELLQREIALEIGVSQMQVSRIITGAVARMGDHVGSDDELPPLAA